MCSLNAALPPALSAPAFAQNKMKINDWSSIQSLFDELNKRLDKMQKMLASSVVPRPYIKLLVELEDFLNDTLSNKDVKKKMSPTNAKALNTMRQRLKKHNPAFFDQMNAFRENPESTEEEESEPEQSGSESEDGEEKEDDGEGFETKQVRGGRGWVVSCVGFAPMRGLAWAPSRHAWPWAGSLPGLLSYCPLQKDKKKDKLLTMDPKGEQLQLEHATRDTASDEGEGCAMHGGGGEPCMEPAPGPATSVACWLGGARAAASTTPCCSQARERRMSCAPLDRGGL